MSPDKPFGNWIGGVRVGNHPFPMEFPFSVQDLRDEFDRLVDRVWHGGITTGPLDGQDWAPRMDVCERTDSFLIRIEVPGVSAEEIDVSILKDTLTIRGTKKAPQEVTEGTRRMRNECRYGDFSRKVELPSAVDEGSVSAVCKDGVLFVRVQKVAQSMGKSVKVTSGE